jgi:2-oxo-4-hydroxy-4-carboxy-5-ureidoimidazoline decarboxylase
VFTSGSIDDLNGLSVPECLEALGRCCGSARWAALMEERRPFRDRLDLLDAAEKVWKGLEPEDWLEAFAHHPRIGDLDSPRTKFPDTADQAEREQSGTRHASGEILRRLAEGNNLYEIKFGYTFIVSAAGKSAEEMLALLKIRLPNDPGPELKFAAAEQLKITRLRLENLLR